MNKRSLLLLGFAIVVAVQLAVPAWMIVDHERTLAKGQLFKFRTRPVDPADAFRGRYVWLSLEPHAVRVPNIQRWRSRQKAFAVLEAERGNRLFVVLRRLLNEVVIEPHLSTTFRKMSQRSDCSLRFYPEGSLLRPTGIAAGAGFSGDRLGNVLGMWADLGILDRQTGGYGLSERGRSLAMELQSYA